MSKLLLFCFLVLVSLSCCSGSSMPMTTAEFKKAFIHEKGVAWKQVDEKVTKYFFPSTGSFEKARSKIECALKVQQNPKSIKNEYFNFKTKNCQVLHQ